MRYKKLRAWGRIAEITASSAVVISVFFIVFELRSNTNSIQAQTYQSLTSDLNDWRRLAFESPWLRSVTEENWQELSTGERQSWRTFRTLLWTVYENAYFARERGILGDSEWARFAEKICPNYRAEQFHWNWREDEWRPPSFDYALTPEFMAYVQENCTLN